MEPLDLVAVVAPGFCPPRIFRAHISPPCNCVAVQGYLPGQLYDLESKYGNQEQLVGLIAALKEAGIKPMADIVINHR